MRFSIRDAASFLIASRVPNLIIIGMTQIATAYFLLGNSMPEILNLQFAIFLLSTAMIAAGGYIINDYFDQKIDLINRPDEVVVGTKFRRRLALFTHTSLTLVGIILGLFIDPLVAGVHVFSAGALWTYSGILKRRLLIGTLTISFLTMVTLLIVMVYYHQFSLLVLVYALFGCVSVFIRESIKDIVSLKGERVFGVKSVPIVWGFRGAKTVIYIAGLIGVGMISFYLISINNWHVRYFFAVVLVTACWVFYKVKVAERMQDFMEIRKWIDTIIVSGIISMALV